MWKEVCTFAKRQCPERNLIHGVIVQTDASIFAIQAKTLDTGEIVTATTRQFESLCDSLEDVACKGDDCVRIECHITPRTRQVVRMSLSVVPELVDARMSTGRLTCEVALINLVAETWDEICVPTPTVAVDASETDEGYYCDVWRSDTYPLFAHQVSSLRWMRGIERTSPRTLSYNTHLRITDNWHVDPDQECFTNSAALRSVQLVGGICCDGTGTGKTATMLYHVLTASEETTRAPYASRGSLILLPLNLVSQWREEFRKFVVGDHGKSVLWIFRASDFKGLTMQQLVDADIVFTTFHFLRSSKPYTELVERTVGVPKSRAAFSSWARVPRREEPLFEAVTWKRIIVDELHSVFESGRDMKQLRLLRYEVAWGLTATPYSNTDQAQRLYMFLRGERGHHPNLLATLLAEGVRGTPSDLVHPQPQLELVHLSDTEKTRFAALSGMKSVEEVVKLCTFVDAVDDERVWDLDAFEELFLEERRVEMNRARMRLHELERVRTMLTRSYNDACHECETLAATTSDDMMFARYRDSVEALERHVRDLKRMHQRYTIEEDNLKRRESASDMVYDQLLALKCHTETCVICMERECVMITPCAHIFCAECVKRHVNSVSQTCPTCRAPLNTSELARIVTNTAIQAKLSRIGALIRSFGEDAAILFVQWKVMVKGMRAFLQSIGIRVWVLDGNTAQRALTLNHFQTGGVLLLCMEDSFAGLHLPHAHHVVFAHALVGDSDRVGDMERQAIARCVRHGQTAKVSVHSFVVAGCEEEVLWRQTHSPQDQTTI